MIERDYNSEPDPYLKARMQHPSYTAILAAAGLCRQYGELPASDECDLRIQTCDFLVAHSGLNAEDAACYAIELVPPCPMGYAKACHEGFVSRALVPGLAAVTAINYGAKGDFDMLQKMLNVHYALVSIYADELEEPIKTSVGTAAGIYAFELGDRISRSADHTHFRRTLQRLSAMGMIDLVEASNASLQANCGPLWDGTQTQ